MQAAYVVEDLEAAIRTWAGALSVGPFFVIEHLKYVECEVEGEPSPVDISAAFAYSGDLQIELIQQHNDAPSIYVDRSGRPAPGLHHWGICTDDIVADEARLVASGFRRVQRSLGVSGAEVIYFSGPAPCFIELIRIPDNGAFYSRIKQASETWDGRSPFAA